MPKSGFKTITITALVYNTFEKIYLDNKEEYAMNGINSFAAYITDKMEIVMYNRNTIERYPPRFETISIKDTRIILKDNKLNRIVEIMLQNRILFCQLCKSKKCSHIGFCYSLYQIYGKMI